ncbi:MAG: holo-ACP synthase [Nocardioides sp.]
MDRQAPVRLTAELVTSLQGWPKAPVVAIGVDVVDIDDFEQLLRRRPGLRRKLFSDREVEHCQRSRREAEGLAARFAAKEAVLKALGIGIGAGISMTDIEVLPGNRGAPDLMAGERLRAIQDPQGICRWLLTLTHESSMAVAVVAGLAHELPQDPNADWCVDSRPTMTLE